MKPLAWSHSSLSGFETCPRQYQELKVLRNFQDQKNPASIWGDEYHKSAEKFIQAGTPMPANMEMYNDVLIKVRTKPGTQFAERMYGLNIALAPCSFYDTDVWCRGIIDALTLYGDVADVDDWKTGKNRKKDMQQLIIFALLVFYHHPEINTCHTAFHWLQLHATDTETFHRHQIPEMWATLIPKLDRYMRAFHLGIFPPKKSGLCRRHCAVDTCEYYGGGK